MGGPAGGNTSSAMVRSSWKFSFLKVKEIGHYFYSGKKVDQYHEENGKRATVINLGVFNQEKHIEWIKANPSKAPRKNIDMRKQVLKDCIKIGY